MTIYGFAPFCAWATPKKARLNVAKRRILAATFIDRTPKVCVTFRDCGREALETAVHQEDGKSIASLERTCVRGHLPEVPTAKDLIEAEDDRHPQKRD